MQAFSKIKSLSQVLSNSHRRLTVALVNCVISPRQIVIQSHEKLSHHFSFEKAKAKVLHAGPAAINCRMPNFARRTTAPQQRESTEKKAISSRPRCRKKKKEKSSSSISFDGNHSAGKHVNTIESDITERH